MRKILSKFIKNNDYFLHADMWNENRFPFQHKPKILNMGLNESNLLNIAAGISHLGNVVYIYGVCGFLIYHLNQLKFSLRDFGSKTGKIIICNAGKVGYENLGAGHILDDDIEIMKFLNIDYYIPKDTKMLITILEDLEKKDSGIFYIQLGKDET